LPQELALVGITDMPTANRHRCYYLNATVRVHRYANGDLAVFHGPRKLADYNSEGKVMTSP
jgi:hypothetical protein